MKRAKPKSRYPIPAILTQKQPVLIKLAEALGVTRWHAYGLTLPITYRKAIPSDLFDTRSDLARRVAHFAGVGVEDVRTFYAKRKAAKS